MKINFVDDDNHINTSHSPSLPSGVYNSAVYMFLH